MAENQRPERDDRRAAKADARVQRAGARRGRRGGSDEPLTRELIVRTALEIVDRDGEKALSMRRLGAELGVDPMAVYYYLPNKSALIDGIVEAVMSEIDLGIDDPDAPAEERVMCAAWAYLQVMLAHANAIPIMLSRGPNTPEAARPVEYLIGVLRDAGLSPIQAMAGMNAIAAAVRGVVGMAATQGTEPPTQDEMDALAAMLPAEEFPYLQEATMLPQDFARDFEFGMRALVRGLLASREP